MASEEPEFAPLPVLMADVYGRYAREVILDRALPDARDGLKPSQRRILYGMAQAGHTPERPFVKSARVVGDVMGHFHPHGDSSIYGALVRMSQWWVAPPLVELSGNGGSLDDDPPAAMRYTEVRLSALAMEMVRDLDKDTVPMQPNFDESETEPEVLPAYLPALLTLGASGVAVGFACEIPPHNLGEVIEATVALARDPALSDRALVQLLPGPDFPTGGLIVGLEAARRIEETGQGKIVVRGRVHIERDGRESERARTRIVISELPYRVVKAQLVAEIDRLRASRQVDGLVAVRDESDHEAAVRIVIELRGDTDPNALLALLYRKTALERTYTANMTAIVDGAPRTAGVRTLLLAYLQHLRAVIRRRTEHDLAEAERRLHILEGLLRAADDLDAILQAIRTAPSRAAAKERLRAGWALTDAQAEAILTLQLYRLTGLEIQALRKEAAERTRLANRLRAVLADPDLLTDVMVRELRAVKERHATPRRTVLVEDTPVVRADPAAVRALAPAEEVVVAVSALGDVKRVPLRSYLRGETEGVREGDALRWLFPASTRDTVLFLFADGALASIPVADLVERRWRESGQSLAVRLGADHGPPLWAGRLDEAGVDLFVATNDGLARRTRLDAAHAPRRRAPIAFVPAQHTPLVLVAPVQEEDTVAFVTTDGRLVLTQAAAFPRQGRTGAGVRAVRLDPETSVAAAAVLTAAHTRIALVGARGSIAALSRDQLPVRGRGSRGLSAWISPRRAPEPVLAAVGLAAETRLRFLGPSGLVEERAASDVRSTERGKPPAARIRSVPLTALSLVYAVPEAMAKPDAPPSP